MSTSDKYVIVPVMAEDGTPLTGLNFEEAKKACAAIGGSLLTENKLRTAQQDRNPLEPRGARCIVGKRM